MSHTPGPWTIDEDPRPGMSWNRQIMCGPGHTVCFMAHSAGQRPERDEANAYLVAAAPDLLAALRKLVSRDFTYYGGFVTDCNISMDEVQSARAAIAKATDPS